MKKVLSVCVTLGLLMGAAAAEAQNIDLASGGADPIWHGTQAGANAGKWMDTGPLNSGDSRRDLVIGAPGSAGIAGKVYVIFGGPVPTGDISLSNASVVISGAAAGDGFGSATAVGPILVKDTSSTHNLIVGAPGAMNGRGVVYVFANAMTPGSLTTANAIYRIIGNTADHLGAAIATADINNDGYRELVLGAPGNGRVYVVAGGSALSGTRDLSTSSADLLINGPGIGSVLQAGDLTGDGVFEILIGSPTANAVYLLTGGYPAVSNLPADADAVFSGIDVGDATGASMRIADIDADGRRDLAIGAPGGDGPGNSRPNAGEVYVLWGRNTFSSMNMANADVTFYGALSGYFLGEQMTAGDVNRDTPNDLVILSSGAGAAGEMHVFYGRSRSKIGTATWDGRRIVDFASFTSSRRIIGDPASGPIVSAAVFEVTGEGARDIVVGVSSDDGDRGAALFTISPKMVLSPSSISVTVDQGAQVNRGVILQNPSTIMIGWTVSSDSPWLTPSPTSATSVAGDYGSITAYIASAGLPVGTYKGALTFTSTSEHLDMARTVNVTLTVKEATVPPPPPPPDPTPVPPDTSNDFSGDGRMDLLFRNVATGDIAMWTMDGSVRKNSQMLNPYSVRPNWRLAGTGDFNGDSKADILWQEEASGTLFVWFMNGITRTGYEYITPYSAPADPAWKVVSVADMNGDGKVDLVWQNAQNAALAVWMLNGTVVDERLSMNPWVILDHNWKVVNTGDFNGDGKTDLLWKHATEGWLIVWYMNGPNRTGVAWLDPYQLADIRWQVVASGDLNGDGKTDIVFQHPDGRMVAWFMDGVRRASALMLIPDQVLDANWRIAAPK